MMPLLIPAYLSDTPPAVIGPLSLLTCPPPAASLLALPLRRSPPACISRVRGCVLVQQVLPRGGGGELGRPGPHGGEGRGATVGPAHIALVGGSGCLLPSCPASHLSALQQWGKHSITASKDG